MLRFSRPSLNSVFQWLQIAVLGKPNSTLVFGGASGGKPIAVVPEIGVAGFDDTWIDDVLLSRGMAFAKNRMMVH